MDERLLEQLEKLMEEFHSFKIEITEKVNDLVIKEDNDYHIFEDIVTKIDELQRVMKENFSESYERQQEILENLSEKIAMLMIRK